MKYSIIGLAVMVAIGLGVYVILDDDYIGQTASCTDVYGSMMSGKIIKRADGMLYLEGVCSREAGVSGNRVLFEDEDCKTIAFEESCIRDNYIFEDSKKERIDIKKEAEQDRCKKELKQSFKYCVGIQSNSIDCILGNAFKS